MIVIVPVQACRNLEPMATDLIGLHFGCLVGANVGCERGFCRRLILEERRPKTTSERDTGRYEEDRRLDECRGGWTRSHGWKAREPKKSPVRRPGLQKRTSR